MSTGRIALPTYTSGSGNRTEAPKTKHPLISLYERYSPSQGWATFVFLLAMLVVMGDSVDAGRWIKTPGIISILFYSLLVGLGLSKIRIPAIFLHLGAMIIGAVVVYWQILAATDDDSLVGGTWKYGKG